MDYSRCYQILGLRPGSDWNEAVKRYRSLASRHHPDRQGNNTVDTSAAAADINVAYCTLKKYYQSHGVMPFARQLPTQRTPFSRPNEQPSHSIRKLFFIGMTLGGLYYGYGQLPQPLSSLPGTENQAVFIPEETVPMSEKAEVSSITPGDPLGKVIQVLGPPEDMLGVRWYYGDSWIQFRDGRVVNWYSTVDNPLPVSLVEPARRDGR